MGENVEGQKSFKVVTERLPYAGDLFSRISVEGDAASAGTFSVPRTSSRVVSDAASAGTPLHTKPVAVVMGNPPPTSTSAFRPVEPSPSGPRTLSASLHDFGDWPMPPISVWNHTDAVRDASAEANNGVPDMDDLMARFNALMTRTPSPVVVGVVADVMPTAVTPPPSATVQEQLNELFTKLCNLRAKFDSFRTSMKMKDLSPVLDNIKYELDQIIDQYKVLQGKSDASTMMLPFENVIVDIQSMLVKSWYKLQHWLNMEYKKADARYEEAVINANKIVQQRKHMMNVRIMAQDNLSALCKEIKQKYGEHDDCDCSLYVDGPSYVCECNCNIPPQLQDATDVAAIEVINCHCCSDIHDLHVVMVRNDGPVPPPAPVPVPTPQPLQPPPQTFWRCDAMAIIRMHVNKKVISEVFILYVARVSENDYLCHRATSDISVNFKGPLEHHEQYLSEVREYLEWYRTDPLYTTRSYWGGTVSKDEVWQLTLVKDLTSDFYIINYSWIVETEWQHQVKEYTRTVLVRTHLNGCVSVTDIGLVPTDERYVVEPHDRLYAPMLNFYEALHKFDDVEVWHEYGYTLKVDWERTRNTSMEDW